MAVERSFENVTESQLEAAGQQGFMFDLGWSKATGWEELLHSKRVLIVSEAGAGKTYECQNQCKQLWDKGEAAFFIELATLATNDLRVMLGIEEEARLDAWLASQSDVATFFLDSVDELKLTRGSFELALKGLNKGISNQLARARIIITTRPIPFDEQLIRRLLPVPQQHEFKANGDTFAQIVLQNRTHKNKSGQDDSHPDWRMVGLTPLSDAQIEDFARDQGVDDPQVLLKDLLQRNAQEFARRPQDLIELCADWRDFKRIRTHREQVTTNIRVKLNAREDRPEPAELSVDRAIEGASRLALAMIGTRHLTIRHSAAADDGGEEAAIDPTIILSDWSVGERKALLERPLFGFASYGRVRFHHRSVVEHLAAERIQTLRARGMPTRALKRLLFAQTRGKTIVRPSKRPLAGWLALTEDMVFETLRDNEPAVLLSEGDPEALSLSRRKEALRAYVDRYGRGGWRGLSVPIIQIHRFASPELGPEINHLWAQGIQNPEVRETLLDIICTGLVTDCADVAYSTAIDSTASRGERLVAIEALAAINDVRLVALTDSIAQDAALWPDNIARGVVLRLFPKHLTVAHLCAVLARVPETKRSVGDLSWRLPRLIADADFDDKTLESLRDGLNDLLQTGLQWKKDWPHIVSDRPHLCGALAAVCIRGLEANTNVDWLHSCALVFRVKGRDDSNSLKVFSELKEVLDALPAEQNKDLFWADDALIQSLHPIPDPRKRFTEAVFHGAVAINRTRDFEWIKKALSDRSRLTEDRAMLLETAMQLSPGRDEWKNHLRDLKPLIVDIPELKISIDDRLNAAPDKQLMRWEVEDAKRKKQQVRREAKDRASWIIFWREVADNPDTAFNEDKKENTVWNLWQAMSQDGEESRASGWSRKFIETYFDRAMADRLRLTLMGQWRNDCPTLASERSANEKNSFLVRWQLGLAAIYAESEDPKWVTKLTHEEAKLATRFAPIELNGFPLWMGALADAHPKAIIDILGKELNLELAGPASDQWHSTLLQNIDYAPENVVAIFRPLLSAWLDADVGCTGATDNAGGAANRLARVVNILMKHGDKETHAHLCTIARLQLEKNIPEPFVHVWLPILLRLDANAGVSVLESLIEAVEPAQYSEAVTQIGNLFGDHSERINVVDPQFTPTLLLQLLRIAYHHIRTKDDLDHEGCYRPDGRDAAERARNEILNALLGTSGEDGWAAKLELADDPLCAHFRDRIVVLAEEHWAEEIDATALTDTEVVKLDLLGEAPPTSNEAMFSIMVDRLDDLSDLLLRDTSPHEAWAGIQDERVMRRELARELSHAANSLYKVDQEAVTADEKETDIRLRSTASNHEAIIELKLADGRSGRDLRDTIKDQLVKKYMAAETSRSGCLLITVAKVRYWLHPDTNKRLYFQDLVEMLRHEASRVMEDLGGTLRVHVHGLDLCPRLPTEAARKSDGSH